MLTTVLSLALAVQQLPPRPTDADTKAWWNLTSVLSADSMEGRDTGSPGYQRAADVVAHRLAAAGVKPLGDNGTWFQSVPMEEVRIATASIHVGTRTLDFLRDITTSATVPESVEGALVYRGYCGADALGDVRGKLVVCHATRREGLPSDQDRRAALTAAGAAGMIAIADPGFTIEPPRWPFAYVRSVSLAGPAPARRGGNSTLASFTLNAAALGKVIAGSGQNADSLDRPRERRAPAPVVRHPRPVPRHRSRPRGVRCSRLTSWECLPGSDPALADQAIVLSAHLDGYGYGEPVKGDSLYNGTLDDAAYVALIVRLAERREGKGFKRPIIFAIVTGEEKGLNGSRWFVSHLPVPKERIAGDINLDQLRPLFPLDLLTVHALDDTSLGDDARAVATSLGITVQNDPEPERNLLRRSDHWTFLQAGIPAVNFVFGFKPNTESERIYRRWYREGYHTPAGRPRAAHRLDRGGEVQPLLLRAGRAGRRCRAGTGVEGGEHAAPERRVAWQWTGCRPQRPAHTDARTDDRARASLTPLLTPSTSPQTAAASSRRSPSRSARSSGPGWPIPRRSAPADGRC